MKRVIWLEGLFIFTALGFFTTNGVADELYYTEFADEDGAFIQPSQYIDGPDPMSETGGAGTSFLTRPDTYFLLASASIGRTQ